MIEITTILGLVVGFVCLIGAHVWEAGGDIGAIWGLINPSAGLVVFGGTAGALLTSYPLEEVKLLPRVLQQSFRKNDLQPGSLVSRLVQFAEKARREGLLALETEVASAGDPFLQKGIQLVADGLDQDTIKDMLETELDFVASRHAACYGMLDAMGGFAPTMGIIGTVMGLINVLANLENAGNLGAAIAVAFVATLYGVGSANLIWLPMGQKLKRKSEEELLLREVMIAGIISIQAGDNPQIVEEKLKSYLSPATRKQIARGGNKAPEPPKGKK
ncbi:MAG: chemotaxis protein MotA [Cyanobacteria bacterium RYN_339]|nr:chemotaxis protein MotA [Cyanobacteria bacterium RYN_339]